jgi:hypothetical protein
MAGRANPFDGFGSNTGASTDAFSAPSNSSSGESLRKDLNTADSSAPTKPYDRDREEKKVTVRLMSTAGVAGILLALYACMSFLFSDTPKRNGSSMMMSMADEPPKQPGLFHRLFCSGLSRPGFCGDSNE